MPTTKSNDHNAELVRCQQRVKNLQFAVYSQPNPAANEDLLTQLAQAQRELSALEKQHVQQQGEEEAQADESDESDAPSPRGSYLGAETTGLSVSVQLLMDPLPTGAYHLMDPESDPLLSVEVENHSDPTRRVSVRAFIEGLSAQAVRTVEIENGEKKTLKLLPTLFPEKSRLITEIQRATLHVVVDDLDGKLESHNTYTITCLARTASFNSIRRPGTGKVVDLSHYYGAWVTPNVDLVQDRIRNAAAKMPDRRMNGYGTDTEGVTKQVEALYESLREAEIVYFNSVIDYGTTDWTSTQRTRLPRESLEAQVANCIDGTVLMASMLEGISLSPAIVLMPGHALVGWDDGSGKKWNYLETTMIGSGDFAAACRSGQILYENNEEQITQHAVDELRQQKIWPME